MKFWNRLAILLKERGWSQRKLAIGIGVSPSALTKYAQGALPNGETAIKMAEILGVSLDFLLTGRESDKTEWHRLASAAELKIEQLRKDMNRLLTAIEDLDGDGEFELKEEWLALREMSRGIRHGEQAKAWAIVRVLAAEYPRRLTVDEVVKNLSESKAESDDRVRCAVIADLAALVRIGAVVRVENEEDEEERFELGSYDARLHVTEQGDTYQLAQEAVNCLLTKIIPAASWMDRRGYVVRAFKAVPAGEGQGVVERVMEHVRNGWSIDAGDGKEEVSLVIGVAVTSQDG